VLSVLPIIGILGDIALLVWAVRRRRRRAQASAASEGRASPPR